MGGKSKGRETARISNAQPAATERSVFLGRLTEREGMLDVLRRQLLRMSDGKVLVRGFAAKPTKSRKSIREGRCDLVYRVEIEAGGEPRECVLLGVAPVTRVYLDLLAEWGRELGGLPWAAPFRELTAYVEDLDLALLVFPLDPALPGLADVMGTNGARVLAACLPECGAGAEVRKIETELVHYKPFNRAVLKVCVSSSSPERGASTRTVYAKLFADDHGAESFRNLSALWDAARRSSCLRVPEPLGYDGERRMLVMGEAAGGRDLNKWIKCLERGVPLPDGVDLERVKRCILVAAGALLELQRSEVRTTRRRTLRHEVARLKEDSALLLGDVRAGQRELAACAEALVARLERLAPDETVLVPAHGAFRHKQMVGDEHALTLIDWDGFSLASPALDAASFLGRLLREPRLNPGTAPELELLAGLFRRTFLERHPELASDLDLHDALVLTQQVLRCFRRPRELERTAQEVRRLAAAANGLLQRVEDEGGIRRVRRA